MKQLYLAILGDCNQKCLFCVRLGKGGKPSFLSFSDISEILERKISEGYERVLFDGGEPTLRNDLWQLVRLVKETGYKSIDILTNGVRLADNKIVEKIFSPADKKFSITFSVSLHSHIQKISDKLTGKKGTFGKTIKGIENLTNVGCRVSIYHVITTYNYRHLPSFVEFVAKNFPRVKNITFSFIYPTGAALENLDIYPQLSKVEKYFHGAVQKCRRKSIKFIITTCGTIPLCFLKGCEDILLEQQEIYQPSNIGVVDSNQDTGYQLAAKNFHEETKIKPPACRTCFYYNKCAGIWRVYVEKYGLKELKPVLINKKDKNSKDERKGSIAVITGFSCNNNCIFCSVNSRAEDRMADSIILDAERGFKEGYRDIELLGGEAAIRKDFFYLLSSLKKIGFKRIRITSNGRIFSYYNFLKKAKLVGLTNINFSLHGHQKILHDGITRTMGSFEQCVSGIKNSLIIGGLAVDVNTVVSKLNYTVLNDTGIFLRNLGIKRWNLLELLPDGRGLISYEAFAVEYDKLYSYFRKVQKEFSQFEKVGFFDFPLCLFDSKFFENSKFSIHDARSRSIDVSYRCGDNPPTRYSEKEKENQVVHFDKYKIKPVFCHKCKFFNVCSGMAKPYYEKYGIRGLEKLVKQNRFIKQKNKLRNNMIFN